MVVDNTYYNILGVAGNATSEEIKRAYRKKSLDCHPDQGGSVEKMQQLNAAKEVLMDPEKRRIYDQYGLSGPTTMDQNNFSGTFTEIPDIFDLLMNGSSHSERSTVPKGSNITYPLKVSLEELYSGKTRNISIDRQVVCNDCDGTGCKDKVERECTKCKGKGVETQLYHSGAYIQQIRRECSSCNGKGTMINPANRCNNCQGDKVIRETKNLEINIPPGSSHEETIKFIGEGNQIPKGENGTLFVSLEQEPHPLFQRLNDDLVMELTINLSESLCGFQRIIKLLDGHTILVKHPPAKPIVPNSYRCIKGQGMPNRNTHSYGDLIIHFDVEFPDENFIKDESQLTQLEAILPPKKLILISDGKNYEEAEMTECEVPKQAEFESPEHDYPQRTQCTTH